MGLAFSDQHAAVNPMVKRTPSIAMSASVRSVVATCRNPSKASGLDALQHEFGDRLIIQRLDVTEPDSLHECASAVETRVPHLNLLFNMSAVLHVPGAQPRRSNLLLQWAHFTPHFTSARGSPRRHPVQFAWYNVCFTLYTSLQTHNVQLAAV